AACHGRDLAAKFANALRLGRFRGKAEMQARGITLAQRQVIVNERSVEASRESRLDSRANLGRKQLSRDHHQGHNVAAVSIGPDAELHSRGGLEVEDQAKLLAKFGDRSAKQFILRKAVKRGYQLLVGV